MTSPKKEKEKAAQEKIESISSRAMQKIKELSKRQRAIIETFLESVRKRRMDEIRKDIHQK